MKNLKIKKIIFLLMFFSLVTYSQTTIEEYNYVTKGYKVQVESGLDMKKGYELEDVDEANSGERVVKLFKLKKVTPSQNKVVAYLLKYQKGTGSVEYICIPHPNSGDEIISLYWKALYPGDGDSSYRLQLIAYLLSKSLRW